MSIIETCKRKIGKEKKHVEFFCNKEVPQMRIAILTQPLRYNYGGILQNFALQTVLRRMGHEVVTLDPKRYKFSRRQHILHIVRRMVGRYLLGHYNNSILGRWKSDNKIRKLGTNTFKFVDKYIKRKEYADLYNDVTSEEFDAYIVGSDQVWRPEYNKNLPNMFLDFTRDWEVRRIAYAASYGVSTWSANASTTEECRMGLRKFDLVTVREDSGISLCNSLFGVKAQYVLDPTLLLTKEDYYSMLHLSNIPKSKGNLLVYILDYTEDKRKLINRIAEEHHLVPFRVNSDYENYRADLNRRIQPPVEQWLRGFYDADYVVTDSYHACIFSIIFKTPFVVYANAFRGTARYDSLLEHLFLQNNLVFSSDEFHGFNNYLQVSIDELEVLRKESIEFLKRL